MLKSTSQIISTLEDAINLFSTGNSALNRDKAKLMVFASKCALQALALDMADRRFNADTQNVIEAKGKAITFGVSKGKGHARALQHKHG